MYVHDGRVFRFSVVENFSQTAHFPIQGCCFKNKYFSRPLLLAGNVRSQRGAGTTGSRSARWSHSLSWSRPPQSRSTSR